MRQDEINANGIRFAYLTQGSGPLLLLLHGWPDNAHSWEKQIPVLAEAGYTVVAPFLRGYPPTEVPVDGYYDRATLAKDIAELIVALNGGEPALLVAQDWGAAISYGVLGAFPERVRRAVLLAVPHPAQIRRTLRRSPIQAIRSFHWFLFQLPSVPESLLRARNFAFMEFLWRLWSPNFEDHAHVARIKKMMSEPGALEATLSYYRAMMKREMQDPALTDIWRNLDRPITTPTLVLCGSHDMRGKMLEDQDEYFAGEYRWGIVEGAGHFLHRERPREVNERILAWLSRSS